MEKKRSERRKKRKKNKILYVKKKKAPLSLPPLSPTFSKTSNKKKKSGAFTNEKERKKLSVVHVALRQRGLGLGLRLGDFRGRHALELAAAGLADPRQLELEGLLALVDRVEAVSLWRVFLKRKKRKREEEMMSERAGKRRIRRGRQEETKKKKKKKREKKKEKNKLFPDSHIFATSTSACSHLSSFRFSLSISVLAAWRPFPTAVPK